MKTALEIYHDHKSPVSKIKPLTKELFAADAPVKKASKFRNKWVIIDAIKFQSIGEGNYYLELKDRMQRGDIKDFKRQIPFEFFVEGIRIGKYVADFGALHFDGSVEIIDYKSRFTVSLALWQMKRQLMLACYQTEVKEVGKNLKKK